MYSPRSDLPVGERPTCLGRIICLETHFLGMELLTSFERLGLFVLAFIAKDLPGGVFGETSGLRELVVYPRSLRTSICNIDKDGIQGGSVGTLYVRKGKQR